MKIIRKSLARGAEEARGLAVVIDVFRAFSCQPLFFHLGAQRVIPIPEPERARKIKEQNPEFILVGEVNEAPLEGADMGNSPSQAILKGEGFFKGRTVVHRTTAGVTGAVAAAKNADQVVLGSFVTARAIARYIKDYAPREVTLVAMGDRAREKCPEDEACADYLEHLLSGGPYDPVRAFKEVVFQRTAQKFIQGRKTYLPREDPLFCLQRDVFDFVLVLDQTGEELQVLRMDMP